MCPHPIAQRVFPPPLLTSIDRRRRGSHSQGETPLQKFHLIDKSLLSPSVYSIHISSPPLSHRHKKHSLPLSPFSTHSLDERMGEREMSRAQKGGAANDKQGLKTTFFLASVPAESARSKNNMRNRSAKSASHSKNRSCVAAASRGVIWGW